MKTPEQVVAALHPTITDIFRATLEGTATVVEEKNPFDGAKHRRTVIYGPWVEHSCVDCFCCSCDDGSDWLINDPYCRNHGGAGTRPCELHNLPGAPDEAGDMPDSVQEKVRQRALHAALQQDVRLDV